MVFETISAPFFEPFGGRLGATIAQKGETAKEGGGLWRRLRARGAQGYPLTPKKGLRGSPRDPKCNPNGTQDSQNDLRDSQNPF